MTKRTNFKHYIYKQCKLITTKLKTLWNIIKMTDIKLDETGKPVTPRKSTRKTAEKTEMDMWTRLKNPTGTIYIVEILKAASKEKLEEDKIKMIRIWMNRGGVDEGTGLTKNATLFKGVMECLYDPRVIFDLPAGKPPYLVNEAMSYNDVSNTLFKAIRKVKLFAENSAKVTNTMKRENLFIQQLETMYKDEAELFIMMVNKKLDAKVYPTITEDLCRKIFPNVLPKKG